MDPDRLITVFNLIKDVILILTYVMGVFFVLMGIFKLKRYGEMRTQMSTQMTILSPLMPIFVGTLMLIYPKFFNDTIQLFFNTNATKSLNYQGADAGLEQYIKPILMLVRLIGLGAMVRGLVLLSRVGGQQSQPGSTGKALIHLIGGILAARIGLTIDFIMNLFGV